MSEPKEDIDLLSQKELEDGELEDGELDEPVVSTNDNESEIVNADILDDSDVNMNDKSALKNKRHKHKKGLHRKRHLNSEEKNDNKWKKSKKSNDEGDDEEMSPENIDSKNIINLDSDSPSEKYKDSDLPITNDCVGGHTWGYESDEPTSSNCNKYDNNKCDIKQNTLEDSSKSKPKEIVSSPLYEPSFTENKVSNLKEPVEAGKWNDYDSEDEGKAPSNNFKSNNKSNSFDEPYNQASKRWDNNNFNRNDNRNKPDYNNWQTNNNSKSPVKSFDFNTDKNDSSTCDKGEWDQNSPIQDSCNSKIIEEIAVSPTTNIDKGKWDFDSGDEGNDNSKNWTSQNSPKKNDNTQSWGCGSNSPKRNDDCPKWESSDNFNRNDDDKRKWSSYDDNQRNNDNQRWGSRDSPKGNDDDNNQRWGSRDNRNNDDNGQRWGSRDGSRRNNFRRWGGRDGSRRNNNFRRWGSRDGSQRGNNNQRWGNNNGSPQRNNDNNQRWGSSNNGSPQRSDDKWGSNDTSPQRSNSNKKWGSSNNNSPQRSNDDNKKWGSNNSSPQRNDSEKNKLGSNNGSPKEQDVGKQDMYDLPQKSKWCSYDSDDDAPAAEVKNSTNENKEDNNHDKWGTSNSPNQSKDRTNSWDVQNSPKAVDTVESGSNAKWGDYDSDEEGKAPVKENTTSNTKSAWKSYSDDDDNNNKGSFNESDNRNKGYNNNNNNNNWNRNDRNDFKNDWGDKNKRWNNRNDNEKRGICKFFASMGTCRNGDRCTYLHETPNKPAALPPSVQEPKKKELCKFYEHQQCYKRANCSYMHEEFPCKLFHAGSKMCPSGDSCKYSHAPLNQETKTLLEKYLDEKVDERTDKNGSEWSSIIKKSAEDDDDDNTPSGFDQPESFFPDTIRYRYPGSHDMMRFPRPWTAMMRYGDMSMQVPPQMDFMHRQRLMYDRFQYPMPTGRMFPRGFRGIVPPNMHEGFPNGMPFPMPSVIPGAPKLIPGNQPELKDNFMGSDPYIDNLAQIVVGLKESPKRLMDMIDPNLQSEDLDDFPLEMETNNSKKNLASPVIIKSPEVPPGAYVPRTSMNAAQPNVRLGPGPGFGGDQAMLYGGYPGHPGDSTMMDYINMSALHYFHNHTEQMGFDIPWKLIVLEVPIKIPYPLMVIETQDLMHKYTDPRLKGHPSVLNSSSANEESILHQHQNSYDFNSIANYGSQLQSPNFITTNSESSETLTPINEFMSKSDEPDSPLFPIGEDIFNFKSKLETEDLSKRVTNSDRSYLQDPRFKRKKVVNTVLDPSEME